ncbi:hypothetical protein HZB07_06600 [Candidatus Saganbacteria bacterium]|nr:hypothetical protein [Candidatus Saganbacteria bacterium]
MEHREILAPDNKFCVSKIIMHIKNNFLVAAAYLFGIPALYIALTDWRKKDYVGFHGGQALVLWCWFFVIFFAVRLLVDLVWGFSYIPILIWLERLTVLALGGYAVYCAYRAFYGQIFKIPH